MEYAKESIRLIPAEEARAMSDPDGLALYIYKINRQIWYATNHQERNTALTLWDCDERAMVRISARLQAAGYSVRYRRYDNGSAWVEIGW